MEKNTRFKKNLLFILIGMVGIIGLSFTPTVLKKLEEASIRESLMNSFSTLKTVKQKSEDTFIKNTEGKNNLGSIDLTDPSLEENNVKENKEENTELLQSSKEETQKNSSITNHVEKTETSKQPAKQNSTGSTTSTTKQDQPQNIQTGGNTKPNNVAATPKSPTILLTSTPSNAINGYVKKQVASITFSNENANHYIKTSRIGSSNVPVTASCGSGEKPENCITIASTKKLNAGTWYQVSGEISVTYEENTEITGTISAISSISTNFSSMTTKGLLKISTESPTKPTISNPTGGNWTNKAVQLTLTSNDTKTGIAYFAYSYDNKTWNKYANSALKTFTTPPFNEEQNRTIYIRACNQLGICSLSTSTPIRIEKTGAKLSMSTGRYTITSNSIRFSGVESYGSLSGIGEITCKYSTRKGSYTQNASVVENACEMKNLKAGTTYYYEYCVITKALNKTCAYGSAKTRIGIATSVGTRGTY